MATIIKSVSITAEENEFLLEHNLSPSGLLKQRIQEIQNYHNQHVNPVVLKLQKTIRFLNEELQKANDKLIS